MVTLYLFTITNEVAAGVGLSRTRQLTESISHQTGFAFPLKCLPEHSFTGIRILCHPSHRPSTSQGKQA